MSDEIAGDDLSWSINTQRLVIRRATPSPADIALLQKLWAHPEVMKHVGFPSGLKLEADRIEAQLKQQAAGEFDCVLIVALKASAELLGECKLGSPDDHGVARTDIKLLPQYWGNRFGVEVKRALLDYLFEHTSCRQVTVDPNVNNQASISMQEAVGGRRTGEGVHKFPEHMAEYTCDVPYRKYTVYREDWLSRRQR